MTTIPRNHKRKVADVKERATSCRVFSLRNDFVGVACEPAYAWSELSRYDFARLVESGEDKWTIRVHDNLWYELRPAQ